MSDTDITELRSFINLIGNEEYSCNGEYLLFSHSFLTIFKMQFLFKSDHRR